MLECLVIANNITVTTNSETSIHRGKDHKDNMLFVKLGQEVYNKMRMFPAEYAVLMSTRIL